MRPKRMLSAEFEAVESPSAQALPEFIFRLGCLAPKFAGKLNESWI